MKKSMHINGSIPVTITHVKENRKNNEKKGGGEEVLCGHDDHERGGGRSVVWTR